MFSPRVVISMYKLSPTLVSAQRTLSTATVKCGSFNKQHSYFWPKRFVENLTPTEKQMLFEELMIQGSSLPETPQSNMTDGNSSLKSQNFSSAISYSQLRMVAFAGFVPFVGFGFLDNAIMIVAGSQPWQVGCVFKDPNDPLAAGFGNLFSDLFGIGMVGYVERFSESLGCSFPPLTVEQLSSKSVQWATILGRVTGITVGCLLGMLPLLWFDRTKPKNPEEQDH